jgi:hypothetical protein
MADEKIVVIRLELDTNEYTSKAIDLNKQIKELKTQQTDLKKSNQDTGLEYQRNAEILKRLTKELATTNKVIDDVTRSNKANAGSNEQLRAQLSVLTYQYNNLSKEERENTTRGKEMQQQVASLTDTLKANESAVGDNRRNVGNYAGALKELKAELKLAKDEMVVLADTMGEDSDEFKEAQKRAGELNDKIQDVSESTKALTGEPIEKLSGSFGLLGDKLRAGDFKGASAQIGSIVKVSREMTFKQAISGIGGFGKSMGQLGKAIITNPLFLIPAIVIGVGVAFYKLKDSIKPITAIFDAIGDSIGWVVDKLKAFADAMGLSSFAFDKMNQGIIDNNEKALQSINDRYDGEISALKRAHKETVFAEIEKEKAVQKTLQSSLNALKEREKMHKELTTDELEQQTELSKQLSESYRTTSDAWASYQDRQIEKTTQANEKQKTLNDERANANREMLKKIEDQEIQLIKDDELRQFAKAVLDNQRAIDDINKSKASAEIKQKALAEQQKVFESQLTQINKDGNDKRNDELKSALDERGQIELQRMGLNKQQYMDALNNQKMSEDMRIQVIQRASDLAQQIYEKERQMKLANVDAELQSFEARKQLGETFTESELIRIQNLNEQKDLINQEYNKKQVDDEQAKADAIDKIHRDSIEKRQRDFETEIEISKIFLSSLNDLMYIFGNNQAQMSDFAKTLALFQIALDTAKAISGVVAMSTEGDPYTYALRVATGIATVIGNVAKAKQLITGSPRQPNIQQFAEGGQVLSGQKIELSHGRTMNFANGDNMIASVKAGEVILNKHQQQMLGGAETFQRIGVRGFADGGLVTRTISSPVENQINAQKQLELAIMNMPNPVVYVEQIAEKTNDVKQVEVRATI